MRQQIEWKIICNCMHTVFATHRCIIMITLYSCLRDKSVTRIAYVCNVHCSFSNRCYFAIYSIFIRTKFITDRKIMTIKTHRLALKYFHHLYFPVTLHCGEGNEASPAVRE